LAAFAVWALSAWASGRMREPAVFHALALFLVVWVGLSLFWSLDPAETTDRIQTFLQIFALLLITWDLCDSDVALRQSLQALVLGLFVAAGSVFYNFAQGVQAYYGRFAASGADPNYMAMTLAMGLPLAWYLSTQPGARWLRWLNVLYLPVGIVATALTGSRGGLVATVVAVGYVLSTVRSLRPGGIVGLLLVFALGVGALSTVVPDYTFERIASLDDELSEGDLNGRAGIWNEASDAFGRRPIAGVGAGASRAALPTGKVGHNVLITVGLELGIVGLGIFCALVFAAVRKFGSLSAPDRRFWAVMLLIWSVGSLSLSLETRKITWILFTLVLVATELARERSHAPDRPSVPDIRPVATPAVSELTPRS
jgi:O-antigen ligase